VNELQWIAGSGTKRLWANPVCGWRIWRMREVLQSKSDRILPNKARHMITVPSFSEGRRWKKPGTKWRRSITKALWDTGSIVFALSCVLWTFCYSSFDLPSLFKSCVKKVIRAFLLALPRWHGATSQWRWRRLLRMDFISSCWQPMMGGSPDLGMGEGLSTTSP
jgi:hypothetical protein